VLFSTFETMPKIDNPTDLFAPLGFLVAAENVREIKNEE